MKRVILFIRKYWREIAVAVMFVILSSKIENVHKIADSAYDASSEAAEYAEEAANYASDASGYASQAADSATYCEYLY